MNDGMNRIAPHGSFYAQAGYKDLTEAGDLLCEGRRFVAAASGSIMDVVIPGKWIPLGLVT